MPIAALPRPAAAAPLLLLVLALLLGAAAPGAQATAGPPPVSRVFVDAGDGTDAPAPAPAGPTAGPTSRVSAAQVGDGYTPVTPFRVVETRPGLEPLSWTPKQRLGAGASLDFNPRINGVPLTATAVVLTVTGINPTAATYVTVWPHLTTRPLASSLNLPAVAGVAVPNTVTVKLGSNGRVAVYNDRGTLDLAVDVVGYYQAGTGTKLSPMAPVRFADTRPNQPNVAPNPKGARGPETTSTYTIPNLSAGTTAVALNLTGTQGTANTFLRLTPVGTSTEVSNLNLTPNQTAASLVIVGVDSAGRFDLYNNRGDVHVAIDLVGEFVSSGARPGFVSQTPVRMNDTRNGTGSLQAKIPARGRIDVKVAQVGTAAVALNLTATGPTTGGFLSVLPGGQSTATAPTTSSINVLAGETRANAVFSAVDSRGVVTVYNNSGSTDVILDVVGVFGTITTATPLRDPRGSADDFAVSCNEVTPPFDDGFCEPTDELVHWYCSQLPIDYAINTTYAPGADAVSDVQDAVARVALASGLRFNYTGTTTEVPKESWLNNTWPAGQPEMVIAFGNPQGTGPAASQTDLLPGGGVIGVGGWVRFGDRIANGFVVIAANQTIAGVQGFQGDTSSTTAGRGTVLVHEIGHAVGLEHASDTDRTIPESGSQVMAPFSGPAASLGRGDSAGLAFVGC